LRRGQGLSHEGRYVQAEKHLLAALALARADRNDARLVPISLYYLGDLYFNYPMLPRAEEAEALLEESLSRWEDLLGPQHPVNAVVLNRLGSLAYERGDEPRAEELFARSDAIVEASFEADHPYRLARDRGFRSEWMIHPEEFLALANLPQVPPQ
jgi:tetratricopeptide (TPR) repeat protein